MKRIFYHYLILILSLVYFSCSKDEIFEDELKHPDEELVEDKPKPTEPSVDTKTLTFPKKEMRAVWITTAWGLDWPNGQYSVDAQKAEYINYLDRFKSLKINAIFFQVKAMGDAFYESSYEPWSRYITGTRGKAPNYDVLKFLIDEAHARDIEFHAWMNPYRIATRASSSDSYPDLFSSVDALWVLDLEKIQIYNPALPEVQKRLADIVKELITKYDVDGIHFDDYFYPSAFVSDKNVSDAADYQKYGKSYKTIQDFRRANVDKAIKGVHDVIVATKPELVFSIAPTSDNKYNVEKMFADVTKWAKEGWIDVVMPQLYHEIGHKTADFITRLNWWTQNNHKAAVIAGHGFYRFGDGTAGAAFQTASELERQFDLTRQNKKVVGNIMYRAKNVMDNKIGITNQLAAIYRNIAVPPLLGRSVAPDPIEPKEVKLENGTLKWTTSGNVRSVIYYFDDLKKEGKVFAITNKNSYLAGPSGYYCISTINSDNKESNPSKLLKK
ncbi:MAG: family 10 glycosylhydrolase [Dysgonamonadaceae bacterium]|nr:family 10 glycosylhydrolase [Dysgonamonadaceae bacterium]MDD4729242.1 family 10 glycosylhydrolase [Dysgonamonadaceae bacterium]